MAKAIMLTPIDEYTNSLINQKRAELIADGKELTKPAVVMEIIREWALLREKNSQQTFTLVGSVR